LPLSDQQLSKLDLPLAYVAKTRSEAPKVKLSCLVAGKIHHWEGRIMRTDATYDTQSRALFAIVEVPDPYGNGASTDGVPLAPGLFVDDDKGKAEIRTVSVLDTEPDRAVLTSGIQAGELVVLSPMERSRIELTLKVLDVNDPNVVLVDPPKPDWLKEQQKKVM